MRIREGRRSQWLIAGALLLLGAWALIAAPPPFVQKALADDSCTETVCSCGMNCIDGVCYAD